MGKAFDILQERGFFYQLTDEETIRRRLNEEKVVFYMGFDPTADSLHVGHLLPVMAARFLQQQGHQAILLVGGGTAMVGDPSGKTEARQLLAAEQIQANAEAIRRQLSGYLDFSAANKARMVNNADWLAPLNYIEFLRDIGRYFSVNRMLTAESVKQRLQTGLSFLEFNYMLLQAYDFYVLCRDYDCDFQLGGQDQWGNIVAGVDLVRRLLSRSSYGATLPLLTDSQGKKFGKTQAGAVWLDPARTSVFDYYQFWRNVEDTEVARMLAMFTALPMDEVRQLSSLGDPEINRAKEILAYEATALAHGEQAATEAYLTAGQTFGFADPEGRIATSSAVRSIRPEQAEDRLPWVEVARDEAEAGIWVVKLFVLAGLAASNGAARRLIQNGGAYLNDERITAMEKNVTLDDFSDDTLLLRSGKKNICRVRIR